jgi:hypothetical protein
MPVRLLALAILALPATAQAAFTKAEIATAKAEADAIIAKAGVADLFQNITESNVPTVRHRLSGLVCGFEPGAAINHIAVFPGAPRGDDVACETKIADFEQSVYATRWNQHFNTDQALGIAVQGIRARWPAAQPWTGQAASATSSDKGLPIHRMTRFSVVIEGVTFFTRASAATVDGWSILERTTGPAREATAGDLLGEIVITTTLDHMTHPKAP